MSENQIEGPKWMNHGFFTNVIRHHTSDRKATVSNFIIKPSLTVGENFTSAIFRVSIDYLTRENKKSLAVIVKRTPTSGIQADFIQNSPLFEIEMDMYNGPLIEIENLLRSVDDYSNIQPKLIYQSNKPIPVIVLEDLGAKCYTKITSQIDSFDATKKIFQRLAKFHAASFYLINERRLDLSRFNTSMFEMNDPIIREKFLTEPIDVFIRVLSKRDGYQSYIPKLKKFRENFLDIGLNLYRPDPNGYNVLNHGDFHVKNLLFKKDEEDRIVDFYFLDFQVSIAAPPCVDLYYALYNMISDEDRLKRRDEIIAYYHSEFTKMLEKFGYIRAIPTLLDLNQLLLIHGGMEVLKCIAFKIFFYADAAGTQVNEMISSPESEKFKIAIYNDPRYRKFIDAELPRLVQMGFL